MYHQNRFADDFFVLYFHPVLVINLASLPVNYNRPNCDLSSQLWSSEFFLHLIPFHC